MTNTKHTPVEEDACPICGKTTLDLGECDYFPESEGMGGFAEINIHCSNCGKNFLQTNFFTEKFGYFTIESEDGERSVVLYEGDIYDPTDLNPESEA